MSVCHGSHVGLEHEGKTGPGVLRIPALRTLHVARETVQRSFAAASLTCRRPAVNLVSHGCGFFWGLFGTRASYPTYLENKAHWDG